MSLNDEILDFEGQYDQVAWKPDLWVRTANNEQNH